MAQVTRTDDRRPNVDMVFDYLLGEIVNLRLLPGDKISEAEIAARFGVSRQPVRDAFSRLDNMDLILIRPQRATEVRRFSSMAIEKSRFVRAAIEAEVLRRAAAKCDDAGRARLDANLEKQRRAVERGEHLRFGALDYEFHETLCQIAGVELAFEVISSEKAKVDRLCMLSLAKEERMPTLLDDHVAIADCVKAHDAQGAVEAVMIHLARLDSTIEAIHRDHAEYFDP